MRIRGLVFAALFAALFAVLSLVSFHVGIVPITLETLVVMITGALIGPWYGFLTYVIVILLDLAGLPMISGHAGLGTLVGPTAGYIWTWPFCALFTGFLVRRVKQGTGREFWLLFLITLLLGDIISYIPGVLWLHHFVHPWGKTLVAGVYPFIPGDTIKALIAAAIVMRVRKVYPQERIIHGERFVRAES